jgi:hypothetical protein
MAFVSTRNSQLFAYYSQLVFSLVQSPHNTYLQIHFTPANEYCWQIPQIGSYDSIKDQRTSQGQYELYDFED